MIYIVLISLIFTIIAILKNRYFEYHKQISIAVIVYSIVIKLILLDSIPDGLGFHVLSGGIKLSSEGVQVLSNLSYLCILIGMEVMLFSYSKR